MAENKYKDRSKEDLLDIARERDLSGRSSMNKDELADALEKDDQEHGVDETLADKVEGGKNEEGGRGLAQTEGSDIASRLGDSGPSEEATKEYQESYAPKKQKEYEEAKEEGEEVATTGYKSEASDPENPIVDEALEDKPDYDDLDEHDRELADLALDASGPLNIQSPYERVMTGAVDEEQAKEQEEVRGKLPDEFVGDLTEHVSDEDAENVRKAYAGEVDEVEEEHEPPLAEQFKAREEKFARRFDLNREDLKNRVEEEESAVGPRRAWAQNTVLDTTGLGGESDPGKAYNVPELKAKDNRNSEDSDGE